jgi:hypothetical protein
MRQRLLNFADSMSIDCFAIPRPCCVITLSSFGIDLQNFIAGTGCNGSTATILSGHPRASVSREQISHAASAVRSVATVPGPIAGMMLGSPAVAQTNAGTATRQEPEDRGSDIYSATF